MDDVVGAARRYLYYILIGLLSVIAMLFLPMVGSEVGMTFKWPTTPSGWTVFISGKAMAALINVLIFHAFVLQAKVNVKDDPSYREARDLLISASHKEVLPRSPAEINKKEYGGKATSIFVGSVLGSFSLGQAILTYDWMQLLTYVVTIVMGIVFGVLEMRKYEEYYTGEYLEYARLKTKKEDQKHGDRERRRDLEESAGPGEIPDAEGAGSLCEGQGPR